MDNQIAVWDWLWEIPPVTRTYFVLSFSLTVATALDLVSPFSLYFNAALLQRGELWRILTTFLYFGEMSISFIFHMYFLNRYSRALEEGSFRSRPADYVFFLLFGAGCMTLFLPFINLLFMGSSLTFMMVYVWGRRNPMQRMSFLGLFPFTAPYLPWVLMGFSLLLGSNALIVDVIGVIVGHVYFYLADVLPAVAESRGWRWRKFIHTPTILCWLCGQMPPSNNTLIFDNTVDLGLEDDNNLHIDNDNNVIGGGGGGGDGNGNGEGVVAGAGDGHVHND